MCPVAHLSINAMPWVFCRGSSDEDEFYDRTVVGGQKKQKRQLAKKPPAADDAATIYGRKVGIGSWVASCMWLAIYQVN